MAHDDHHHHHHSDTENIKVAFFLNLAFTIIEIVGGIMTNSVAILSDALHDLGDSLSLGLAWYFQKVSKKGPDKAYSYGYKRFSLLGALINSVILIVGSLFILREAVPRIWNPEPADAGGMIGLAILGVIVNGAAVLKLKDGTSLNEKVVSVHLMEDVLGWVAVLIGAIVMYFFDLPIIDPILSVLIACFIFYNVFKSLQHTSKIILQGIPNNIDEQKIRVYLQGIPEIESLHNLHIWSMDGEYNILTVHIVLKENKSVNELVALKKEIRHELLHQNIHQVTIEFEVMGEECGKGDCVC